MGIVSIDDAMERADDVGLDLMEVSPNPSERKLKFGEEERIKIAKAGYEHVKKNHTWNNRINQIYDILKNESL